MKRLRRLHVLFCLVLLMATFSSCRICRLSFEEQWDQDEKRFAYLSGYYIIGTSRSEIAAFHERTPIVLKVASVSQPIPSNWSGVTAGGRRVGRMVLMFEKQNMCSVAGCDVYSVLRGYMGLGFFMDYLFFDEQDKLLGHHRYMAN